MAGMAKSEAEVDSIAIAPSFSFLVDVAGVQQVSNYLSRCPFCDVNSISQIPGSYSGVASDIAQYQSMIGEKCPLRHISPPFNKFLLKIYKFSATGLDKQHFSNIIVLYMIDISLFNYHELDIVFKCS